MPMGGSLWIGDEVARAQQRAEHERTEAQWDLTHVGSERVAVKRARFRDRQFDRGDRLRAPVAGDGRLAGGAKIFHPIHLAEGADDPAPAVEIDHGDRRGARLTRLATANGEEGIRPERYAAPKQPPADRIEERNEKRHPGLRLPGALAVPVDRLSLREHGGPPREAQSDD